FPGDRKMRTGSAENSLPESHVPRFLERVDTSQSKLASIRLSWLLRARPSATLHEIQGLPRRADLPSMLPRQDRFVKKFEYSEAISINRFVSGHSLSCAAKGQQRRRVPRVSAKVARPGIPSVPSSRTPRPNRSVSGHGFSRAARGK